MRCRAVLQHVDVKMTRNTALHRLLALTGNRCYSIMGSGNKINLPKKEQEQEEQQ